MPETKRGFTLLELLAVMAIIVLLAGLGAKGYRLARRQAKEGRAMAELETLRNALNEYRVEFGRYPRQDPADGFRALPEIGFLTNAVEGAVLEDPWGEPYRYVCTNRFLYTLWSVGQDGSDGTEDDIGPSNP